MMKWKKVDGFIAATSTPMQDDGSLNISMIESYVQHLVNIGVKKVFVNGTSGESQSLTVTERKAIAEAWIEHGKGKLDLIIIHCGAGSLADTKELVRHASQIGADCVSIVGPTYFKPRTVGEVIDYLADAANAAPNTPLMYYHIPIVTGINIRMTDFFQQASEKIPSLIGAKFTSPDLHDAASASALFNGKYDIILGADGMLLGALAMGIRGFIGISFSVVGRICNRLMKAFDEGNLPLARKEQMHIIQFMNLSHNAGDTNDVVAAMKALTPEYFPSLKFGPTRKPVVAFSKERIEKVKKNLDTIHFSDEIQ